MILDRCQLDSNEFLYFWKAVGTSIVKTLARLTILHHFMSFLHYILVELTFKTTFQCQTPLRHSIHRSCITFVPFNIISTIKITIENCKSKPPKPPQVPQHSNKNSTTHRNLLQAERRNKKSHTVFSATADARE